MTARLKRLFTVKEYHRMVDLGILTEDDRMELIRGEIFQMAPIGRRHAAYTRRLNLLFSERLGQRSLIDIQNPIELSDYSEPQPDVVLLRPQADFYESRHPRPDDILLLVEVADTTVESDRTVKIPLYAENRIAEVWLIDVQAQCLEVYRQPAPEGYQTIYKRYRGEKIIVLAFPDQEISVDEILG